MFAALEAIEFVRNSASSLCLIYGLEDSCLNKLAPPTLTTFGPTEFTDTFLWLIDF